MVRFPRLPKVCLAWALMAVAPHAAAQSRDGVGAAQPVPLRIPRVSQPPKLEDFLNGTPREAELAVTDFRQREPGDGIPVSQPTRAYLSYDQQNLYVVFVCREEPGKVRARMAKREDIFSDDRVGVFLDTFQDRQRAYAFLSNPLGIQLDGISTEGQGNDYSFDTLWHTEGRLTPDGFIVWMAIPFKSLRFPSAPTQKWNIALGRILPRNSESSYWPYVTRRREGFVPQLAAAEGLEQISHGRNLQFIPYGLFARARFLDLASGPPAFRTGNDWRGGLDAKIVLKDALTLDIAVNPDFSQVESDEPQVTINQRFEVFFPEKRPFFIENAAFFETRQNLFFTRRVADPQFGVRLTGKIGRWALGALAMDDRAPGKLLAESDPRHGRRAAIGVARVQREFGRQSGIGFLVASRDFVGSSNRVFSVDTRLKLNPNWVFTGQIMRSYDRTLEGLRRAGPAYLAELSHSGRHFLYFSRYLDRSPDFRSGLGFVPRSDIRLMEHFVDYSWKPEGQRLVSYGPSLYVVVNWDRRNRLQDWILQAGFGAGFTGQTNLELQHAEVFELFQDIEFRQRRTELLFSSEWLSWLGLSARFRRGTAVNFFPAGGLAPFLVGSTVGSAGLSFRPAPRVRWDQTFIYTRLDARRESAPVGVADGTGIFTNHILRSKLNYQFTRALSLRMIFDYNAVLPNPELVSLERAKRFSADFLLTYLLHPGTALYVGYTDIYDNLELLPGDPPILRRIGRPTTSTGRQFFAKVSHLFRF